MLRYKKLATYCCFLIGALLLAIAIFALRDHGFGPVSGTELILSVLLLAAGTVLLVRPSKPKISVGHAALHVPGFHATQAGKHIAIEGKTGRLWMRDNQRGERVIAPEQLLDWRVTADDTKFGIEATTTDPDTPVLFARTGDQRESADMWAERIAASRRK